MNREQQGAAPVNPSDRKQKPVEHHAVFPPAMNAGCFVVPTPDARIARTTTTAALDCNTCCGHPGHCEHEEPERWDGMA